MATAHKVLGPQSTSLLEELNAASNHMNELGRAAVRPSDEATSSTASLIATPCDLEPEVPS